MSSPCVVWILTLRPFVDVCSVVDADDRRVAGKRDVFAAERLWVAGGSEHGDSVSPRRDAGTSDTDRVRSRTCLGVRPLPREVPLRTYQNVWHKYKEYDIIPVRLATYDGIFLKSVNRI